MPVVISPSASRVARATAARLRSDVRLSTLSNGGAVPTRLEVERMVDSHLQRAGGIICRELERAGSPSWSITDPCALMGSMVLETLVGAPQGMERAGIGSLRATIAAALLVLELEEKGVGHRLLHQPLPAETCRAVKTA